MKISRDAFLGDEDLLQAFCILVGEHSDTIITPEKTEFDIDLKIEGVDCDFTVFVREFIEQMEQLVEKRAEVKVTNLVNDMADAALGVARSRLPLAVDPEYT